MPPSRMMPPIVKAFTGLCRGIVMKRELLLMTACFAPGRTTWNPAFSNARIVIDARELGHRSDRDFDLSDLVPLERLFNGG
jgi:hypothetical protein